MNKKNSPQQIIFIALFAALTIIGTMLKIPLPTGAFIHFGNSVVLLAVLLLGYWQGSLAGGLGFFIFDLLNGYATEAPYFLVESFVVGAFAYLGLALFKKNPTHTYQITVIALLAGSAKFVMSVLKATVMGWIAGADWTAAFLAALASMPATIFNIITTTLLVTLIYFPLKKAFNGIAQRQFI